MNTQDNSDSSDFCDSPLKKQVNKVQNISEPQYVESSMEEKERIERESKFCSPPKNTDLKRTDADFMKNSIISESSDSEEDKIVIKRCLRLNRKSNETLTKEEKQTTVSKTNYTECDREYFASSTLDKDKEKFNDAIDTIEKNINNQHLHTPKKHMNNKSKNTIISDSDTDSPHSKHSNKQSPRKEWAGPDIRLNLKDLGLNKQLGLWVESIQKKPAMSIVPVSFNCKIL